MSIDSFMESHTPVWGSVIEIERRNRIRLAVAAYAYEFCGDSIMSDGDFDKLALKINPSLPTVENYMWDKVQVARYKRLDEFFRNEFSPDTGQWIHKHPELAKVAEYYFKIFKKEVNNGTY